MRISAPLRMTLEAIRLMAISKLAWIKQQQQTLRSQPRETPRDYIERESHYLWGRRHLLKIVEREQPPCLELKHKQMLLQVRPSTDKAKRQTIIEAAYRQQLRQALPALIAKWERLMGVSVAGFTVKK